MRWLLCNYIFTLLIHHSHVLVIPRTGQLHDPVSMQQTINIVLVRGYWWIYWPTLLWYCCDRPSDPVTCSKCLLRQWHTMVMIGVTTTTHSNVFPLICGLFPCYMLPTIALHQFLFLFLCLCVRLHCSLIQIAKSKRNVKNQVKLTKPLNYTFDQIIFEMCHN